MYLGEALETVFFLRREGKKMKAVLEGNELVIRLPVNHNPQPSKTGKTLIVATSNGNKATTVQVAGRPVVIGVNAYIKAA